MKFYLLSWIIIVLLYTKQGYGQTWPKVYNHSQHHTVRSIVEDYDHGYLITGQTYQGGAPRWAWIKKTDVNGEILWEKVFGDYSFNTFFSSIIKSSDNGTILAGGSSKYDPDNLQDPLILKIDPCGNIEWCTILQSINTISGSTGIKTLELADGSLIVLLKYYGTDPSRYRISLAKLNASGIPIWIQNLAQVNPLILNEEGYDLLKVNDSSYVVSGHCFPYPNGQKPYWIHADEHGEQTWEYISYEGSGSTDISVLYPDTSIFTMSVYRESTNAKLPHIFRISHDGQLIGKYPLLGDTIAGSSAIPLVLFNDTVLFSGIQWRAIGASYDESNNEAVLFDTIGIIIKRKHLIVNDLGPECAIKTHDDKLLVAGTFVINDKFEVYLWKLNDQLEFDSAYTQLIVYDSLCPDSIISNTVDYDCNFIVNIDEIPSLNEYRSKFNAYPNPADNYFFVEKQKSNANKHYLLEIFDSLGKKMEPKSFDDQIIKIDSSTWPSGIYLLILREDDKLIDSGKIIIK
ncbi:MAG: T9SS type A sorting domain-containing protein [Bacteroidota bacterium]